MTYDGEFCKGSLPERGKPTGVQMRLIEHAAACACAFVPSLPASGREAPIPKPTKTSACRAAAFGAGFGLAILSCSALAAPAGGDTVQGLYDALLSTMKNGLTLGQSGRFTQLEPFIRRSFDIPSMTRLSVGPSWAILTEAQRQQRSA